MGTRITRAKKKGARRARKKRARTTRARTTRARKEGARTKQVVGTGYETNASTQ